MQLRPPKKWRETITQSIGELLGEKNLEQRLNEIRKVIQRMDQRWDLGFITNEQDYIEQRLKLQQLSPIDTNDLEKAVDLLDNFRSYCEACNDDAEAQHDLVKQVVERVYKENRS